MRNRQKGWWRSLCVRRSFVFKVVANLGKRYGELPKSSKITTLQILAISWNTFTSLMFACKAWNAMMIFQCRGWAYGMPKEIPKTIPKRYLYWNDIVMASLKFDWARTHNMNRQSWTRRIANLYISDLWYVPKHFKAIHSELWKTILISHRAPSHIEFWLLLRCFLWPVCTIIQGVGGIRCIMLHNVPMLIPIFKRICTRQNVQHFCRHGRMIFLANTIHIFVLSSACGHEKLDGLKQHKQI